MKNLLFLFLFPLSLQAYQQPASALKGSAGGEQITITCKIVDAPANAENIFLYEQLGLAYRVIAQGPRQSDGSYLLTAPMPPATGVYAIGFNETQNGRIVLGKEKQFTLWANAQFMEKGRTIGSEANKGYETLRAQMETLRNAADTLRMELRQAKASGDQAAVKSANERLRTHGKEKMRFLESVKKSDPLLWRSATLQLSPDYTTDKTDSPDELAFYSKTFFDYANLSDAAYETTPDVFDAFKNYVLLLSQLGASASASKDLINAQLAKLSAGTNRHRRALSGAIAGLQAANHPDYMAFSRQYISQYKPQDLGEIGRLENELKRNATFTPGAEAPDLVGNTPEGEPYALSKLRGKYVLIDFWASWCGPCRRENPNVVAMYNRYKEKGFDILGVSLDREAPAWTAAIEKDGLSWHHISDLKGWKSEHAALYSVNSIPQTLLIDPDGRIIQRNLRGEQLAEKLREIFGE